jgi:hypothetical protein
MFRKDALREMKGQTPLYFFHKFVCYHTQVKLVQLLTGKTQNSLIQYDTIYSERILSPNL